MKPNPGHLPKDAEGKRVLVRLRNGREPVESWPADGRTGCRWTLRGEAADITHYQVAK